MKKLSELLPKIGLPSQIYQMFQMQFVNRLPHLTSSHVVADKYYTSKYNDYMDGKPEDEEENITKIEMRNDECCVCLCDIEKEATLAVMLCETCHNGIHTECWNKWSQVNGSNRCVYCRTDIKTNAAKTGKAKVIEDAGWGVLLQ